jgi:hypothetical protein
MRARNLAARLALFAWLPLATAACGGTSFDDPGIIKGLRVLAVQKSSPYPKPGETVGIKLLFWDGKASEDNPRDLLVTIFPRACENPIGDLYYNCLATLGGGLDVPDGGMPDADVPDGDTPDAMADAGAPDDAATAHPRWVGSRDFSASNLLDMAHGGAAPVSQDVDHTREANIQISPDIIEKHGRTPGVDPYGLAYVLFAACAGHLGPVLNPGPNTFPLGCFDNVDNRQLGADDFVIGYSSMYVYADRVNRNPVIDDFLFEGVSLRDSTTDEMLVRHVPSCKASDRDSCPKHPIKLAMTPSSTVDKDDDPTARTPDGRTLDEQVWVNYYLTRGSLKSSVRLVNDATRGWNEQNGTEFTAPAEPGPVRLFAVVHDNRGGMAWSEGKIIVD